MAVITGKDGVVTLATSTINGHTLQWAVTMTSENVKGRGMGDAAQIRTHLFYDWKVVFQAECLDQDDMSIRSTGVTDVSLLGTEVAFVLKRRSSDGSGGWFSGTGLITEITRTHKHDDNSLYDVTLECSQGVNFTNAPTPVS